MVKARLNKIKYENAILFFINKLGVLRGKKKLAKLLYFADFGEYEKFEKSITKETYYARDMGPLGFNLAKILSNMIKRDKIIYRNIQEAEHLNPTHCYEGKSKPNLKVFSDKEVAMLKYVLKKYGHNSGTELELISHNQAPYIGTELNQEIPYELALYRGTFDNNSN